MCITPVDLEEITPYNQALSHWGLRNKNRDIFFEKLDSEDFDKLIYRCEKKYFIKAYLRKIVICILGEKGYIRFSKWLHGKREC